MPTLQEQAQQAQMQNVPGGGVPVAPSAASQPAIPNRARPPGATTTSQVTTTELTAEKAKRKKEKEEAAAAAAAATEEEAAAAAQVGFGGTGDPMDFNLDPTGEDFFKRFGPGFMDETQTSQFNTAMGGALQQPGMGEQQIQGSLGKFNMASASEQQYARALAGGSGMDPYYDRARETTMASMDQALAARGAFGSSMGIGQIGQAMAGLGAEQANREADFMQQAAAQADQQKIARLGMGGELALGGQRAGESRFTTGLQGAMGVDAMAQAQFSTGANAAIASQAAKTGRLGDYFNMVMKTSGMGMENIESALANMSAADREMLEQQIMMDLGISKEELNQLLANQAQSRENLDQGFQAAGEVVEAGGNIATGIAGGAGGGGSNQTMPGGR